MAYTTPTSPTPIAPPSYFNMAWSQPAVKLLLITGLALAILGALVLIGINYPVGILALLAKTFKEVGAGFMMGSGLMLFLQTAISTFVSRPQQPQPTQMPHTVLAPAPAPVPNLLKPPALPTGHAITPGIPPGPVPGAGARSSTRDHNNLSIE